jgi:hypothetical protein
MNRKTMEIQGIASDLIEMFPDGVPDEACQDSADANNYGSMSGHGELISADDIYSAVIDKNGARWQRENQK